MVRYICKTHLNHINLHQMSNKLLLLLLLLLLEF